MSSTIWKGHITLGDLALAVRFESGPTAHSPGLKQIHATCGEPAGQKNFCKGKHGDIPRAELGRAADIDGRLILIPDDKFVALTPKRSDSLPLSTIGDRDVDPLFYESTYYIHPTGESEPAYADLRAVLLQERIHALSKIVLQRERYLIIRPGPEGLLAHTLFYGLEARRLSEFRTSSPDLRLSPQFYAAAIAAKCDFDPNFTVDPYPVALHQLVESLSSPAPKPPARAARARKAA